MSDDIFSTSVISLHVWRCSSSGKAPCTMVFPLITLLLMRQRLVRVIGWIGFQWVLVQGCDSQLIRDFLHLVCCAVVGSSASSVLFVILSLLSLGFSFLIACM